jgi:hypothetical protein
LAIANPTLKLPEHETLIAFAELTIQKHPCWNVAECSATLWIGKASLELHQEMTPELLKDLVETLQSC